ncbi:copper resistance system multicopper oxidase [uncultured Salinisphaera sp.]|uniref:copper resistance system multicopper oxidase n=1 Tax=uncultured Salinisphaera sp. TaxID=359372 RepID=UPI0032B2F390
MPVFTTNDRRRRLLRALVAAPALAGLSNLLPAYARPARAARVGPGGASDVAIDLHIRRERVAIAGGHARAITLNGTTPGPLIELYEGQNARLRVHNHLDEPSSIHWHGILLPFQMDGVPGVAFPGIPPGESFEAAFPVRQAGTYWYHSHSGFQEQKGQTGPLVIHPAGGQREPADRDYVLVLNDWTFEHPDRIFDKLKKMPDYYNFKQRTVGDFVDDVATAGLSATLRDRLAWNQMRMSPRDIADVTAQTYHHLINGLDAAGNWTGLFTPGQRIRLRVINASSMTYYNVRLPGLAMTVVAADGKDVEPVEIDEFQIGVAETFDVIVTPTRDRAYTIMAESMDRSGYVRATLAPRCVNPPHCSRVAAIG